MRMKIIEAHKAALRARQEAGSGRARPKPQKDRKESPIFEPEHVPPPIPVTSQPTIQTKDTMPLATRLSPFPSEERQPTSENAHKRKLEEILNGDEDDLEGDGNEIVEKHDPDSEPLPDLPMYHPAVREVEVLCYTIVSELEQFLEHSAYKDSETEYLLKESKELEHPPHETHILRIALVGDAGQGKSSLLNSMLGYANLAIHAADGNSVTYVVVEYAQAAAGQKTLFEASVEFHSRQACRDIVRTQVKNYYIHAEMDKKAADEEEANENRLAAGTCIDLLRSLFMGRSEFHSPELAEEFLDKYRSSEDPQLVSKLMTWTDNILDEFMPDGDSTGVATVSAVTASDISESIKPFIMKMEFPSFENTDIICCPWPFVKKVRVSLYSRILEQGTIIADLPGTTDKNRARVNAAKEYLQQCDMTIVVNNIDRAIDHAALHNAVNDSYRRRRSGNTIVVCTRSDDLNITTKQSFASITAEEKAMADIGQLEAETNKQLQHIGIRLNSPAVKRDMSEKYKLMAKRERIEREKNGLVRQRLAVRIAARNRHVKQGITDQYRQDTRDRSYLPVFCVSNPIYMQHLAGNFLRKNPPDLSLTETEIPALRTYVFSKPSEGRFATLEHYCTSQLPAFFNTIEMSCSVSKVKRKKDLERTFNNTRAILPNTIQRYVDAFTEHEMNEMHRMIADSEMVWINQARRKCDEWAKLHAAGYTAVLKHDGTWGTKTVPDQEWNRSLLLSVQTHLDQRFEHLHGEVAKNLSTDVSEAMCGAVTTLDEALKVDPAAALSGAVVAFKANLKERRNQIDVICTRFNAHIKKEIRKIQVRATTDDPGHYFTEAMKPIYKAALKAPKPRGRRVHDGRTSAFTRGVTAQGGPFMNISEGIKADWDASFKESTEALVRQLDAVFRKIQHDVTQVCSTKEDDSPEATKFRADLLALLPAARATLNEHVCAKLAECKKPRARTE